MRKSDHPEQMSWMIVNHLVEKIQKNMKEHIPEEPEEQTKEEAAGKYIDIFSKDGGEHNCRMRSRLMQDVEGYPVRRVGPDNMERSRHHLPMEKVDAFNFCGRFRDSMGCFK